MKALGAPAAVAGLATLLALLVHPAVHAGAWLPGAKVVLPAAALLLVLALAQRPTRLAALGTAALVLALGYDAVRGHAGSMTLTAGQGTRTFEEEGPGGARLGYRPLGFDVMLEDAGPDGAVVLVTPGGRLRVTLDRSAAFGGFRFGTPRSVPTGEAAEMRFAVTSSGGTRQVAVVPGQPAAAGDYVVEVERYFPDFALDEKNEPYSLSNEARNPAALLHVRRGDRAFRVFVIRSLPGIHQQEGLDASFALVSVTPAVAVTLSVTRQPAFPLVAVGLVVAALGLVRRP